MTYTTAIRHPENTRYIQLHEWQVRFCQNNHCAALLLSYFIAWHDWKLRNDQYYRHANDISEIHGDGRPHNENAYLFFSTEKLVDGCMGLYGKKAITEGLELLASLGVISIHKNPNPRYHFDKTKYFQFYSQICNYWIAKNYPIDGAEMHKVPQHIDNFNDAKMIDRECKSKLPTNENTQPLSKNARPITDTTNNTTNKKIINNSHKYFSDEKKTEARGESSEKTGAIIQALGELGFPATRFEVSGAINILEQLQRAGATVLHFTRAYGRSLKTTAKYGGRVHFNYLARTVERMLNEEKNQPISYSLQQKDKAPSDYQEDLSKGLSWMGDVL